MIEINDNDRLHRFHRIASTTDSHSHNVPFLPFPIHPSLITGSFFSIPPNIIHRSFPQTHHTFLATSHPPLTHHTLQPTINSTPTLYTQRPTIRKTAEKNTNAHFDSSGTPNCPNESLSINPRYFHEHPLWHSSPPSCLQYR